jgi:hypothetical protein
MRLRSSTFLAVASVCAVLGVAACGDDNPPVAETGTTVPAETTTTAAAGDTTTTSSAESTTTTAAGVTVADIVADLPTRLGDLQGFEFSCPPGHAGPVVAGDIFNCQATPSDPTQDGALVFVVVVDPSGAYEADFGTGIPAGADEIAPPGATCQNLVDNGQPYFYAVAYWFSQGKPAGFDPDGNGHPCEAEYPAADVAAFWDNAAAPA